MVTFLIIHPNPKSVSMETKPSTTYLISKEEYEAWTGAWEALKFTTQPFDFFERNGHLQSAAVLESTFVTYLVSTTGATTIKIRFGFNPLTKSFEIILFGTDHSGLVLTPYYVPGRKKYFKEVSKSDVALTEGGRVPKELVETWKNNWKEKGSTGTITSEDFMNAYGFTRGYNYAYKEFIETLFKSDTTPNVNIVFVLHEYLAADAASVEELSNTFGILLEGQKAKDPSTITSPDDDEDDDDDDSDEDYYDLSAPCPKTC
tara:strand:+ start:336 stop:1115 length:780 start_codon:yes stop_codon:yes gene_type:complete